jgi:hypothetical protein
MLRIAVAAVCLTGLVATAARAQKITLEPLHVAVGTVLTFHVQTRLFTTGENKTNVLPHGTTITVKMLDPIDSSVNHDGATFRGAIASPVVSGNKVIIPSDSEVQGVFALLRNGSHPDGFRYELLITSVTDHGKSYNLTASLNPSFFDARSRTTYASGTTNLESPRGDGRRASRKQ